MTFKEYIEKPVVSFDFDDTLSMNEWDDEENDYKRHKNGDIIQHPNKKMIERLKEHKKRGDIVYVVTSRDQNTGKDDIIQKLKKYGILHLLSGLYFTNGEFKANLLKILGVTLHYDDDQEELNQLSNVGIKGVAVSPE